MLEIKTDQKQSPQLSLVPKLHPVKRWTIAKKAALLDMLLSYTIDVHEVLDFYPDLTADELMEWRRLYVEYGRAGLRTTHQQEYRRAYLREAA
jgi:hypothetical protein